MTRARYCVNNNAQPVSNNHEVHRAGCTFWPSNRTELGEHEMCQTAVAAARCIHSDVNGCYICSRECHTTWISTADNLPTGSGDA